MKFGKFVLALGLLAVASAAMAQTPIDTIQLYTAAGLPNSPLAGTPVTVVGVITMPKGIINGGTHQLQDATGGINFFDTGAPAFALGDSIQVQGTVGSFGGEINISGPFSYTYLGAGVLPAPLELTPSQAIDFDGSGTVTSGDYELVGTLIAVEGTLTLNGSLVPGGASGTFGLHAAGDTLIGYIDSTTNIDTSGFGEGDAYRFVSPMVNFNGLLEIKPRYQTDVIENPGNPAPTIQNRTLAPWAPDAGQSVVVAADITDNSAVVSADLFYRDRGGVAWTTVAMVNDGFDNWSATIPGTAAAGIEYYIEATDDVAQVAKLPGAAPASWEEYAVGLTDIATIQSTLAPDGNASAMLGTLVNVEGVITVAPGEIGSASSYVLADQSGGPWSGILIYEGSGSNVFFRGDKIRISGTVGEFAGMSEIFPQSGQSIDLIAFGEPLPPLPVIGTTMADTSEAWESVIVGLPRATVVDTVNTTFNEFLLKDAASDSSVYIDPASGVSIVGVMGEEMYVTGWLDTRFGRNEVVPRDDADIVLASSVGVGPAPLNRAAEFKGIAPNPFNPNTKISFSTPRDGKVELAIFDVRGRKIRTLINGEMEAGEDHVQVWNGKDDSGRVVSSGQYYARLRFEMESVRVEKMTLLK